jgi:hypothetical protein
VRNGCSMFSRARMQCSDDHRRRNENWDYRPTVYAALSYVYVSISDYWRFFSSEHEVPTHFNVASVADP